MCLVGDKYDFMMKMGWGSKDFSCARDRTVFSGIAHTYRTAKRSRFPWMFIVQLGILWVLIKTKTTIHSKFSGITLIMLLYRIFTQWQDDHRRGRSKNTILIPAQQRTIVVKQVISSKFVMNLFPPITSMLKNQITQSVSILTFMIVYIETHGHLLDENAMLALRCFHLGRLS